MEMPGPGLSGAGPGVHFKQGPHGLGPSVSAGSPGTTTAQDWRSSGLRTIPSTGRWKAGRGGGLAAHCPPFHLLSSGKPVCQLSLGQQQREKVTGWKSDLFEARSHPTSVPASLWEIRSCLGWGQAAFWGLRP